MKRRRYGKATVWGIAVWVATSFAACDSSGTGVDDGQHESAVLIGSVDVVGAGGASGGADLSGIVVSVEGQTARDTTDANGTFRVETLATSSSVTLRFQRGVMDVAVSVDGVTPGSLIRVSVTVSDSSATVDSTSNSGLTEFEGEASLASIAGAAPNRVLTLDVASGSNSVQVVVSEATTSFHAEGDLITFDALERRVVAGLQVRVEGDGSPGPNGVQASLIKAETDDDDDNDDNDDDNDDDEDFEGRVVDVATSGSSPSRVVRLTLQGDTAQFIVDITEGTTTFDSDGDLHSIDALLAALQAGDSVKVEGDGDRGDSGVFMARTVKAETGDDDDGDKDGDDDFEGVVTTLAVTTTESGRVMRVQLVDDDDSYTVDIVEGSTSFDSSGDYTTFDQVIAAHGAGVALEMDGEGVRQEDGVIVATEVEVERDD